MTLDDTNHHVIPIFPLFQGLSFLSPSCFFSTFMNKLCRRMEGGSPFGMMALALLCLVLPEIAFSTTVNFSPGTNYSTPYDLGSNGPLIINATSLGVDSMAVFSGAISGSNTVSISANGDLVQRKNGYTQIAGDNSYVGNTTISSGVVYASSSTAFGTAGNTVILNGGGLLGYYGDSSISYAIQLGASGGTLRAYDAFNGNTVGSLTINGAVSGSGSLQKTDGGFVTLAASNSFTGNTTILDGTLVLANSGALSRSTLDMNVSGAGSLGFAPGSAAYTLGGLSGSRGIDLGGNALSVGANNQSTSYSGSLGGSGGSLVKVGTGVLTLSGNNSYTGGTAIHAGTLAATSDVNLGDASGTLSFNGGTLQVGSGFTSGRGVSIGSGGAVISSGGTATFSGNITGSGSLRGTGGGAITLGGANDYTGDTSMTGGGTMYINNVSALAGSTLNLDGGGSFTFTVSGPTTYNLGGLKGSQNFLLYDTFSIGANGQSTTYSGSISQTGSLIKVGGGNLTLSGTNTYSGNTTVSGGTLTLGNVNAISNSTISMNGGALGFGVAGTQTYRLGGLSGSGSLANSGNTLSVGGNGQSTMFSGSLSGSGGLVKLGGGTLRLSGANTYSGDTRISSGVLNLVDLDAVSGSTLDMNASDTGSVSFSGYGVYNIAGLKGSRNLDNGGNTLSVGANGQSTTYSGAIAGFGGFEKVGAGTLVFTGNNSYYGTTTISGGALEIGAGGLSGSLTGDVVNNSTLVFNKSGTTYYDGSISGTGSVSKSGTGELILTSGSSYTGDTRVLAGSLTLAHAAALSGTTLDLNGSDAGSVSFSLSGSQTVTLGGLKGSRNLEIGNDFLSVGSNGQGTTYSGSLSGTGGLIKVGEGTMALTGNNSYTGGTMIRGGILSVSSDAALGNASGSVTINGATLRETAGFNLGRAITLAGSGGTIDFSAGGTGSVLSFSGNVTGIGDLTILANGSTSGGSVGMLLISGNNSYLGTTTIGSGVVSINSSTAFGNASNTVILSGGAIYTGVTNVSMAQNLQMGSAGGSLRVASGGTLNLSGTLSGTGGLSKTDGGTLNLLSSNSFTGDTRAVAGVLNIANTNALRSSVLNMTNADSGSVAFTAAGAGLYQIGGLSGSRNLSLGSNSVSVGSLGQSSTYSGALSGTGSLTKVGSGSLTLSGNNSYSGGTFIRGGVISVSADSGLGASGGMVLLDGGTLRETSVFNLSREITLAGNGGTIDVSVGGSDSRVTLSGLIQGSGNLTLVANGDLNSFKPGFTALTGSNTFTGNLIIQGGIVLANSQAFFGNQSNSLVLNGGGLLSTNASAIIGRDISLSSGGGTLRTYSGSSMTVDGVISGSGNLNKTDAGSATLTASNSFTGSTRVSGGMLSLANAHALSGSTLEMNGADSGSISFISATNQTFFLGGLSGSRSINNSGDTLSVGGNGQSTDYSGSLSGSGGLIKTGGGVLTLSGNNSYSGGTVINGGTLSVGADNNLGNSSQSVTINGGALGINSAFSSSRSIVIGSNGATINASALGNNGIHTFNGVISGNGNLTIAANGELYGSGDNSMILTGNNTYTGTTTITSGVVRASGDASFGNSSNTLILNGGGLFVANSASTTINRAMHLGSNGGILRMAEYYDDRFLFWGDIHPAGTMTVNGAISGSGNLNLVEGGVVNLNASNSFSGQTVFHNVGNADGFTLNLGNANALRNSTLNINSGDNATVNFSATGSNTYSFGGLRGSGNISFGANILSVGGNNESTAYSGSLNGSGGLIKTGNGVLTLSGNNAYSGGTVINGGTLAVSGDNNLGNSSQSVTINGATLGINGAFSSSRSIVIGSNGATIDASALGDNGIQTFSGVISGNSGLTIAANGSVKGSGDSSMILSGSNTYSGTTTITSGMVRASTDAAFGNASNMLVLNGGGLFVGNNSTTTINRSIQLGSAGGTFRMAEYYQTFQTNYPFGDIFHWFPEVSVSGTYQSAVLTVNGSISGTGGLNLVEGGTVNLTASNSFLGETDFNNSGNADGTILNLGNVNALRNSTLNINSGDNATVSFSVAGSNIYTFGGLKGSANIGFGSNSLSLGGNGQSTTYAGSLSGSGALIKTGAGTLILSGSNSYSGGTVINGGALMIGDGSSSGRIAGDVVDNGSLIFNRTGSNGFAGALSGSGDLVHAGIGTTTLSASNSFSGSTRVIAGKINLGNANSLSRSTLVLDTSDFGSIGFSGRGTLTYHLGGLSGSRNLAFGSNSLTIGSNDRNTLYSGSLSGSGSLTKTGIGDLNLTGSNSYTGGTAVNSGTLRVNGSIAGNLSVSSGAVLGGSGVIAGNTVIAGTHSPGNSPGVQTFGGDLSYQPGASMIWQLSANTTSNAPVVYDQVMVGGNLSFSGPTGLQLVFNDVGSLVNWTDALWRSNQSWTIYQVSGVTTGLVNLTLADYYGLLDATGNGFASSLAGASFSIRQSGQNVVLDYKAAAVPEPSTYALMGLGVLVLLIAARRRRV